MTRVSMHAEAIRCIVLARATGRRKWLTAARWWLVATQAKRVLEAI